MVKLSKDVVDKLVEELSSPWGVVELMCDGYKVSLAVQLVKKPMMFRVMTYVNGEFKGSWFDGRNPAPESKFLRKSVRRLYSPSVQKKMEKALGKRACRGRYDGTYTTYLPDWSTGRAAISHLCKVCDTITIMEKDRAVLSGMLAAEELGNTVLVGEPA